MKNMKTLWAILFTSLLVFSAACGNSESSSSSDSDKNADTAEKTNGDHTGDKDKKELKGALMDWELDMIGMIHKAEVPFKGLASQADVGKGENVDQDAVKDLIPQTKEATDNLEKEVENVKIPSDLDEDMQDKLKSAASDLAASYKARADAAKDLKETSSAKKYASKVEDMNKAGEDKFDSFNKKVNKAEDKLGIEGETDFSTEQQ